MPQSTTAINTVESVVEISIDGTNWSNISGSTNKVEPGPQTADSGMAATFEGRYKIVRSGKYNPVDLSVTILYTETGSEAYTILHGQFLLVNSPLWLRYTPGGSNGDFRYYTGDSNGNKAAGRIVEFPFVSADAGDGGPSMVVFKLQTTRLVREAALPSPSASVSPSASASA